jgi:hypothetical protein
MWQHKKREQGADHHAQVPFEFLACSNDMSERSMQNVHDEHDDGDSL